MSKHHLSRRRFLGQASCAAVGSSAFLSTALNLGMINTAAARPHIINSNGDYKAIVCILLAGGADSYNFLIPTTASEFSLYQGIRGDLALSLDQVQNIAPDNTDGKTYGIHQGMTRMKQLFDQNDMAFLSNIGTLIEPIASRVEWESQSRSIPLGLFSHSDQIMQWQTSVPHDRGAVGVGGRMADILKNMNEIQEISMNISLDGRNRFQAGNTVVEYAVGNSANVDEIGLEPFTTYRSNSGIITEQRDAAISNLVEDVYSNIFHDAYGGLTRQTIESVNLFKDALGRRPGLSTIFPNTNLGQDLRMMADVISANEFMGANRQIFFTTFGGWDHHDEVLLNQDRMLPILDGAIGSLYDAMGELGLQDQVTICTISDFARTLTSNSQGSDHAWGGNSMIIGGAVNGGRIHGEYPELSLDNELNLDERGRMIPQVSVDEFYAELALWFGVSVNDLSYILPNIGNFNDYNNNPNPLGLFV